MAVTLAELLEDRPPVVTARAEDRVLDAMERMLEHDYSQLPVVDQQDENRLVGMLTTTGVARSALHLGEPPAALNVHHAMDPNPTTANLRETLWRALDAARDGQALCVIDDERRLKGLLTGFDFTTYLRHLSEDSLAVADIEATVKQMILRHYQDDDQALQAAVIAQLQGSQRSFMGDVKRVVGACLEKVGASPKDLSGGDYKAAFDEHFVGSVTGEFDRLTFAQFNGIFLGKDCWSSYEAGFELPAKAISGLLDEARDIRNRLAHHRGGLSATERDRLRYCRALLYRVADLPGGDSQDADVVGPDDVAASTDGDRYEESSGETAAAAYEALARHMESIDAKRDEVTHKFETVSKFVEGGLPDVSYQHRSWWSNDEDSAQAKAWLDAGWRVVSANMTAGTVKFARNTERHEAYISAFNTLYRHLTDGEWKHGTPSPAGRNWQYIALLPRRGKTTSRFVLAFAKDRRFRIELYIDAGDAGTNKATFDALRKHAHALETAAGVPLTWERLDTA